MTTRPAIPRKDGGGEILPDTAAAFIGGVTSRAATMKSSRVRATRIPRAPTVMVTRVTEAIAKI